MLGLLIAFTAFTPKASPLRILDLSSLATARIATKSEREQVWDIVQATVAAQGILNRKSPQLYIKFEGNKGATDQFWLNYLRKNWLSKSTVIPLDDPKQVFKQFRNSFKGLVVWDENVPSTSEVADTVAGVDGLIPVRWDPKPNSLYSYFAKNLKLPVKCWLVKKNGASMFSGTGNVPGTNEPSTGSAKDDAFLWAADKFLKPGACRPGFMSYYPGAFWIKSPLKNPINRLCLPNHDFGISIKAFFFDLSPWSDEVPRDDPHQPLGSDHETLLKILMKEYKINPGGMCQVSGFVPWNQKYTSDTGGKHEGVATEWRYAEILSSFNAFMDADAFGLNDMANASAFCHQPLQKAYPQTNLPANNTLKAAGLLDKNCRITPKHYVAIYMGDYDSAAWLYNMLPSVWTDPARGSIPIGWAFDPEIQIRFPAGLMYSRETTTKMDYFISGDSGAGYLNPGSLQAPRRISGLPSGVQTWAKFSRILFKKWDLGITGFIIDGDAPAMSKETLKSYSTYSPDGIVAQKVPEMSMIDDTPVLKMSADLPHDSIIHAASVLIGGLPKQIPSFSVFRAILWNPSELKDLYAKAKELDPNIEFVDPYTLMLLAKKAMTKLPVKATKQN